MVVVVVVVLVVLPLVCARATPAKPVSTAASMLFHQISRGCSRTPRSGNHLWLRQFLGFPNSAMLAWQRAIPGVPMPSLHPQIQQVLKVMAEAGLRPIGDDAAGARADGSDGAPRPSLAGRSSEGA
jgi:hypothetical protein